MLPEQTTVQIDIRNGARRIEFQIVAPAGLRRADVQIAPVPGRSAVEVFSLLRLFPAPVVGNGDRLPVGIIEDRSQCVGGVAGFEPPAGVEQRAFARGRTEREHEGKCYDWGNAHARIMRRIILQANAKWNPTAARPPAPCRSCRRRVSKTFRRWAGPYGHNSPRRRYKRRSPCSIRRGCVRNVP